MSACQGWVRFPNEPQSWGRWPPFSAHKPCRRRSECAYAEPRCLMAALRAQRCEMMEDILAEMWDVDATMYWELCRDALRLETQTSAQTARFLAFRQLRT